LHETTAHIVDQPPYIRRVLEFERGQGFGYEIGMEVNRGKEESDGLRTPPPFRGRINT
jgi:hypothetical protein